MQRSSCSAGLSVTLGRALAGIDTRNVVALLDFIERNLNFNRNTVQLLVTYVPVQHPAAVIHGCCQTSVAAPQPRAQAGLSVLQLPVQEGRKANRSRGDRCTAHLQEVPRLWRAWCCNRRLCALSRCDHTRVASCAPGVVASCCNSVHFQGRGFLPACLRAGTDLSSVLCAGSGILPRIITPQGSPADQAKHAGKTSSLPVAADARAASYHPKPQQDSRQRLRQDLSTWGASSSGFTGHHQPVVPDAPAATGHGPAGIAATAAPATPFAPVHAEQLGLLELPEPAFPGEPEDEPWKCMCSKHCPASRTGLHVMLVCS